MSDWFDSKISPLVHFRHTSPQLTGRAMRPGLLKAVKIGLPIVVVLLVVIYGLVSYMIVSGIANVDRTEQEDHPNNYDLPYEDVDFLSRDGEVNLSGWHVYDPSTEKQPTLIIVHGVNSNRAGGNRVALAGLLFARGYDSLMFDLRAHGLSEGDNSTYGHEERWDVLGAFDYLMDVGVAERHIAVLGVSMGAGASLIALEEEPRIRALIVDGPYANASELVNNEAARRTPLPKWIMPIFNPTINIMGGGIYGVDIGALKPEESARNILYPILVIHGDGDERVPVEHGIRVHHNAHPDSQIWVVRGVDHAAAFENHPAEYVDRVIAYLESRLGPQ